MVPGQLFHSIISTVMAYPHPVWGTLALSLSQTQIGDDGCAPMQCSLNRQNVLSLSAAWLCFMHDSENTYIAKFAIFSMMEWQCDQTVFYSATVASYMEIQPIQLFEYKNHTFLAVASELIVQ